jgi:hypothetical protein
MSVAVWTTGPARLAADRMATNGGRRQRVRKLLELFGEFALTNKALGLLED